LSFSNISCKCHVCSFELNETCYNVINVQQILAKFKLAKPWSIVLLKYYHFFFFKSKVKITIDLENPSHLHQIHSNPTIWSWSNSTIVVTYSQFDSNIRVFYVFLGFFKNTWKYFFLSTFEKYSYFVCHYYEFHKVFSI
jgi:hypothetical protein